MHITLLSAREHKYRFSHYIRIKGVGVPPTRRDGVKHSAILQIPVDRCIHNKI